MNRPIDPSHLPDREHLEDFDELDPYEERRERRIKRDRWDSARLEAGFRLMDGTDYDADSSN